MNYYNLASLQCSNGEWRFLKFEGQNFNPPILLCKLCENFGGIFLVQIMEFNTSNVHDVCLVVRIHGGFGWTLHIHPSSYVGSWRDGLSSWLQDVSRWDWPNYIKSDYYVFVSYRVFVWTFGSSNLYQGQRAFKFKHVSSQGMLKEIRWHRSLRMSPTQLATLGPHM